MKPDTKLLGDVVTALRDAQKQKDFVASFNMTSYGYARDDYEEEVGDIFDEEGSEKAIHALEHLFESEFIPHNCGAPACALGHYALRDDLQDNFYLNAEGMLMLKGLRLEVGVADVSDVMDYFGLSKMQEEKLFGVAGCNRAETPEEAADYIERFIQRIKDEQKETNERSEGPA